MVFSAEKDSRHITHFSTLLQKHCNKKQETEECSLKLCGYIDNHGTYTPLWGVSNLLQKHWNDKQEIRNLF